MKCPLGISHFLKDTSILSHSIVFVYLFALIAKEGMISVRFQGKPFNITEIQVYAPTSNAEEAEVEWFYEDL